MLYLSLQQLPLSAAALPGPSTESLPSAFGKLTVVPAHQLRLSSRRQWLSSLGLSSGPASHSSVFTTAPDWFPLPQWAALALSSYCAFSTFHQGSRPPCTSFSLLSLWQFPSRPSDSAGMPPPLGSVLDFSWHHALLESPALPGMGACCCTSMFPTPVSSSPVLGVPSPGQRPGDT